MLVRFTDSKGKVLWINPVHVKVLQEKKDLTEIVVAYSPGMGTTTIKVAAPIDEVARLINAAMPGLLALAPDDGGGGGDGGGGAAAMIATGLMG
ncbi:MAG: hypothetical protein RBS39_03010 [Phycisphaerales bacterium]|jgi:hypothetical protein|nr:hypothetical protein [Phycisphaerales bacterium]